MFSFEIKKNVAGNKTSMMVQMPYHVGAKIKPIPEKRRKHQPARGEIPSLRRPEAATAGGGCISVNPVTNGIRYHFIL